MAKHRRQREPIRKTPEQAFGAGRSTDLHGRGLGGASGFIGLGNGPIGGDKRGSLLDRSAAAGWRPEDTAQPVALKLGETLFDRIQVALAGGLVDGIWRTEGYERLRAAHATRMAQRLRRAHRYVLDDAATALVSKFGVEHFDLLTAAMPSIRPPFDSLWVEFSPAAKIRALGQMPTSDVPPRSAMLIERASAEYQVYSVGCAGMSEPSQKSPRMPTFGIYEALLDFGDEPYLAGAEMRGFETAILDRLSAEDAAGMLSSVRKDAPEGLRPFLMALILCGPAIQLRGREVLNRAEVDRFCNRACLRWQREMVPGIGRIDDDETSKEFSNIMRSALVDDVGLARFAAAALALLTHRTTVMETEPVERHGTRLRHGRNLPYYGYSTIRVKLPREIAIGRAVKAIRNDITAMRRRCHPVERHWCHNSKLRHGCGPWPHNAAPDPHDWEPVVADQRYRCRRCGCRRWQQDAHLRGDASLGWVHQKRVVVARSERAGRMKG
jgi:hypothetical protein